MSDKTEELVELVAAFAESLWENRFLRDLTSEERDMRDDLAVAIADDDDFDFDRVLLALHMVEFAEIDVVRRNYIDTLENRKNGPR